MEAKIPRLIVVLLSLYVSGLSNNCCSAGGAPTQEVLCSGMVVDYEANTVAKADVFLYELHWAYAEGRKLWNLLGKTATDAQGKFNLEAQVVDSDNVWVVAYKPDLALGWERAQRASADIDFLIRLVKPTTLGGTVLDKKGQPVALARLQLCLSSESGGGSDITIQTQEEWFWTRTDAHGRFSFTHVPEGATADIFVDAPGKAACWTFWENDNLVGRQFIAGRKDIEIVLESESRIEGRVIDSDTGQSVSGVTLLARADKRLANYYSRYRTVSGKEGRFQLEGLPADDYSVQVVVPYEGMPEWVGKDVKVTVAPHQTVQDVNVSVSKGAIIEVTIKETTNNKSIEGTWVNVRQTANYGRHACYYKSVYSDKNGLATFRVPPGEYLVSAGGGWHVTFRDPEPIKAIKAQTYHRAIELARKSSVTGIVSDQQGHPVANVMVASKPVCDRSVRTDSQGRYEVRWYLHPRYTSKKWFLLAQDMDNRRASLIEITDKTKSMDLILEPAYKLSGRVTGPNGRGIPMASIKLRGSMPGWITNVGRTVFTDKQGRYEFRAVPAQMHDFKYRLEVQADGFGPIQVTDVRAQGDPNISIEVEAVVLQPEDQSISGIVVDANNESVAGIEIFVSGPRGNRTAGQPSRQTVTDEQGRFFVDRVCKGPLRIQAGVGGRTHKPGFLKAQGGDKDVRIILGQERVHRPHVSLVGKPLPELKDLKIELSPADADDKMILVCFWDMLQRPSRNCIQQLSTRAQELKAKDVAVVAVQASKVEQAKLDEWTKENKITFLVGMITGQEEQVRFNWGVKSLPWLILTDKSHIVSSNGFSVTELDKKIQSAQE